MRRGTEGPIPTVISLFRRSSRLMVEDLVQRLDMAGYPGVSPSEHLIFENLPPGGARVTELAVQLGMTHQATSELVAALENRGYLERRPDSSDRRARVVVLTAEGRRLVRAALREIATIEERWVRYLAQAGLSGDLQPALQAAVGQAEAERTLDRASTDR